MFISVSLLALLLSPQPSSPISIEETKATSVLLADFETVFRSSPLITSNPSQGLVAGFASEAFGYMTYALEKVGPHVKPEIMAESTAVLLGTKDYLPPNGLGRVRSTRCYIVVLRGAGTSNISTYFRPTSVAASVTNKPVFSWSADLSEFGDREVRLSSLYATQIGNSYIVISNNLEELKQVSEQLISPSTNTTLLGIPEWSELTRHAFWGYRRYQHGPDRAPDTLFTGTQGVSPEAEALILCGDLKKATITVRLLSSNPQDATASNLNKLYRIPPFKPVELRVWETTFPLAGGEPFPEAPALICWLFGLGEAV